MVNSSLAAGSQSTAVMTPVVPMFCHSTDFGIFGKFYYYVDFSEALTP